MAIGKKQECPPACPVWQVSWGDLTTLLLTFFIMMFDVSETKTSDFYLVLSSFQGTLGMMKGGSTLSKGQLEEMGMKMSTLPSSSKGKGLAKSLREALEAFKPEIETQKVRVSEDERGLIITLSGDVYFDPGSAKLKEEAFPVLKKAAAIMNSIPNFVRVEGHTDDTKMSLQGAVTQFETNWELSSARSVNVVRFFSDSAEVDGRKLSAIGFAQYRPIYGNETPEGRAFNRRIDIVILREKGLAEAKSPELKDYKPLPDEEWR